MKKKYIICSVIGIIVIAIGIVVALQICKNARRGEDVVDEIAEEGVSDVEDGIVDAPPIDPVEEALKQEKYFVASRLERYKTYLQTRPDLTMTQIVKEVNCDFDKVRYQDVTDADLSYGVLSLVSKYYYLGRYEPDDLVELGSYSSGTATKMQKTAGEAFIRMADAAALDGIILKNISGYRSYDRQEYLYNNNYAARDGYAMADTYSSRPGYSEHQTGLATDINSVSQSFENTPAFAWLQEHAAEYGFIMRYPEGLEDVTGFMYEPWHYRYVGPEVAAQIIAEGLTYEEYYAYYVKK